jgi:AcrR family transcriptional regulator
VVASPDRQRNPLRTRAAILDAAATLFAERGYAATSLADVGARAGVSRGAPGYCFGSKAELYRAILERAIEEVRAAVRSGRERALASGRSSDDILAGAIGEYFDYLHSHPIFVRLIERAALGGEALPDGLRPAIYAGQEAVAAIAEAAGLDATPGSDASQLLLSMISLCWFPVVHRHTVAPAIGVDLESPAGLERRRQHIMAFVLGGVRSLAETASPHQTGGE